MTERAGRKAANLPPSGTVTFLFTDIEGSTKLWENYPDRMPGVLERHFEILRAAIEDQEGYLFKTVGDECCVAFSYPRDALRVALAAQRALREEEWDEDIKELRVRMALHTGFAEVEHHGDYFGPVVNRVARLLSTAHGGQVLLSRQTRDQVHDHPKLIDPRAELRDMGEHILKDLTHPMHIYQLAVPDLRRDFPPLRVDRTPEDFDERYRFKAFLGEGGFAKVYLAHDERLRRDVAVKVLHPRYVDQEQFVRRFEREARSVAKLSHPNIVTIHDWGQKKDGTYYMVMEHLPGGTLKNLILKEGHLPSPRALEITLQVARALSEAHEQEGRVIHRDIKPENVLLTKRGDAKVADFGIAKAAAETTIGLTPTGYIRGTVHYVSPEQANGRHPASPKSDLYALGVVLYEMLTGKLPFDGKTPREILSKHVHEQVLPLKEMNPDVKVPKRVEAVTMKLLSKDPNERYPDAAKLIEDLERVLTPKVRDDEGIVGPPSGEGEKDEPATADDDHDVDPKDYVDREEYEEVKAAFDDPNKSVIVICGIGGIGKSMLAVRFLYELADEGEGDYKIIPEPFSCRGGYRLESVIADLAAHPTFGEHFHRIAEDPRTARDKIGSLVTALEVTGPYVLFFDDYHEAKNPDLDKFVRHVARHKKIQLLLTSRGRLKQQFRSTGVERVLLDKGLPLDAAKKLLYLRNEKLRSERDVVMYKIWEKCASGHLWALETFAQLSDKEDGEPVAELLGTLPVFDRRFRDWQRRLFSQLTQTEGELALAFSLLRKPLPREALRDHLHELYPHPDRREAWKGLLERSVIYEQQDDIYVMHDLFRQFCIEELEGERLTQHRQRAAQFYLSLHTIREAQRVEWQWEAWEHWTQASRHKEAASLVLEIAETLRRQGRYKEVLRLRSEAINNGISAPGLDTHYIQILKHTKGEYEEAKALAQGLCESDGELSRAWGLETLASFYADESDYDKALEASRESFEIFSRLYDACRVDEVRRELKLGRAKAKKTEGFTLRQMGDCERAIPALKKAIEMQREVDPCIGEGTRDLADSYRECGKLDDALEVVEDAIRSLGVPPPVYRTTKGRILQSQDDFEGAWQQLEEALKVVEGWHDPSNKSGVLWAMGDWHLAKGEYKLALEAYDFALKWFDEWGWLRKAALIRHGMARAYEGKGELLTARKCLRQVIDTFKEMKFPRGFESPDLERAQTDLERVEFQITGAG